MFLYEALARNARAVGAMAATVVDYKLRLPADADAAALGAVHERVAQRWYALCRRNGGLYIKLGQQIGLMNHVVPGEYLREFAQLQDQAPAAGPAAVRRLVEAELGRPLEAVFATFELEPAASASIAQVHRATLPDGTPVAVKVQKPNIAAQMPVDLLCYRLLARCVDLAFALPLAWMTPTVSENIGYEADFEREAGALEASRADFAAGAFAGAVHVPAVHWPLTTRRVLTMEWIDGVKLTDAAALRARVGVTPGEALGTLIAALAYQVFVCGRIHGDPHPGNVLVRPRPTAEAPATATTIATTAATAATAAGYQVVLLDHGLYMDTGDAFRRQYCALWEAMVLGDAAALRAICEGWGVRDPELFASLQLFRHYEGGAGSGGGGVAAAPPAGTADPGTSSSRARRLADAKSRLQNLLAHTELLPRPLIILGRHFNILRSVNKELGSPVNRLRITAEQAARGGAAEGAAGWRGAWRQFVFRLRLWLLETVFRAARAWAAVARLLALPGYAGADGAGGGFESVLEDAGRSLEARMGLAG